MKTTTKMMAFAAVLLAATVAKAEADSYIYWMVGSDVKNLISGEDVVWNYAKVRDGSNYLTWWAGDDTSAFATSEPGGDKLSGTVAGGTADLYWGTFDYNDYNTLVFELYLDDTLVGWSSAYQWIPASAVVNGTSASGANAMVLTGVVPEPTSGLLSLFGLAALALRRRRRA